MALGWAFSALADTTASAGAGAAGLIFTIVWLAIVVFYVATMWIIFAKAGKPGWAAIIPIYNAIVLLQVAGRPGWWLLLYFIPFVDVVIGIIVLNDLSKSFGHGVGFTLGLLFLSPIFLPILAFGGSRYVGRGGQVAAAMPTGNYGYGR